MPKTTRIFCVIYAVIICSSLVAENTIDLEQAVSLALDNYPSIKAALANEYAAHSGIELAKTAYLPRLDVSWQANRYTDNNVTGALFPQNTIPAIIPPISGPVNVRSSSKTAWGSAAGALLAWEPFDFGLRRANVNLAKIQFERALKESQLTKFNLVSVVSDFYIKTLVAKQTIRAFKEHLERMETFVKTVQALYENGLTPEYDLNRAKLEAATAKIQLTQAIENERVALTVLSQFLGMPGEDISVVDSGPTVLDAMALTEFPLQDHPVASLQETVVQSSMAKEVSIASSYAPKINILAGSSLRGSSINSQGVIDASSARGLAPSRPNYGVGLSVTFPLMDYFKVNAEEKIQKYNTLKEREVYDQIFTDLTSKIIQARTNVDAAIEVARLTPTQLKYARDTWKQIVARYESGLVNIVDVVDAELQLVQSDVENNLATLAIWNALLNWYVAQGNLMPFIHANFGCGKDVMKQ